MFYFFFFFQAEDGIRDKLVTGVQTCALPIFRGRKTWSSCALEISVPTILSRPAMSPPTVTLPPRMLTPPLCPLALFSSLISASFLIAVPTYALPQSETRRSSHLPPGALRRVPAAFCSS